MLYDRFRRAFLLFLAVGPFAALPLTGSCAGNTAAPGVNMAITPEEEDTGRFREQAARMEQGDVDLLWVGDSITHFWENYGKDVFEKYYGNRKSMNFAISGDRTGHVIWRIQHSPMNKIRPKMAVVMIGTNNIGHKSSTPAQSVEGIQKIVDMLKEQYPDMNILLLEVFPRGEKPDDPDRRGVEEINAGLRKIYKDRKVKNVKLYSINDLFLDENGNLPAALMPDSLHPNAAGYELWASAIEPFVIEGLGEKPSVLEEPEDKSICDSYFFRDQCKLLREKKDYKILMFGNSITHNWVRVDTPEQRSVWEKYYGSKGAVNLAVGGDIIPGQIWRYKNYPLDGIQPKLIFLEIGVNDLTAIETPKEEVAYGNRYLVKAFRKRWPTVPIIVMKMIPFQFDGNPKHDGATYQSWVDAYNEIIPLYVRDIPNVHLVDISDLYRDENGKAIPELMDGILVHPNTEGYRLWGERLDPMVEGFLKE
ncbi:MAG: GDSL-type esterase/lipase family protein [Thermoguttaceae bacterium]|jgi:lysophospholipase L1-like esterase